MTRPSDVEGALVSQRSKGGPKTPNLWQWREKHAAVFFLVATEQARARHRRGDREREGLPGWAWLCATPGESLGRVAPPMGRRERESVEAWEERERLLSFKR